MKTTKLSRRDVLRAASVMAAYLAAPGLEAGAQYTPPPSFANIPFNPDERRSIAIVGAGVAGLAAAFVAAQAGFRVAVFEGDNRYGGRSLTVRPTDADYRDWWFDKYNPHRLFPEMYVSSYQERPDAPDPQVQTGDFAIEYWPGTREPVELFLNAGPGRIPSNHSVLINLCEEIGVRLEPYIFLSDSNLLWANDYKGEQPVAWREINYSLMGDMAQILYEAVKDGMVLSGLEQKEVLNMLKQFGDLNDDGKFIGSTTVGYMKEPGGWLTDWEVNTPVALKDILGTGFIGSGDPEQSAGSFLFNPNHILWQPTLMQPIGGMDRIWQQLLLQPIRSQALDYPEDSNFPRKDFRERDADPDLSGRRFVGDLVHLNAQCAEILYQDPETVTLSFGGYETVRANFCVVTAAPALLGGKDEAPTGAKETVGHNPDGSPIEREIMIPIPEDMKIASNLAQDFKDNLAAVEMTPACKVGFQGRYRFWEEENQIYGGISWTTMISSQIWYPSEDFNAPTGILTGAYNRGSAGWAFGKLNQAERVQAAIDGGETLHTDYRQKIYADDGATIAWQYMPNQIAGWAAETYTGQCDVYQAITTLPQGNIYFAGDTYSQTPGWQEGAVDSARLAIKSIVEGLPSTDPALYPSGSLMRCPTGGYAVQTTPAG